ncbi:uncharacterized protein LOC125240140 [Leguminivora glycinivorella]|uniref:uncharacterized protein LOC125240140 n=1 Tax=Leguminivora glycinivorella TaxID=1035111 RepID=UPI00200D2F8A|nr:uncharacterized protein LOC125240140 [Leguminivora glycinivorella]
MINLKQKLVARPKAFYVGLDEDKDKAPTKSDEDVSYEDDFESYESDFDSYHSERSQASSEHEEGREIDGEGREKEKDEENMLDSGSFDLREQRSAKSKPTAMEFITETEEDKASSLDEGFQDSSSAVSSMRTVEVQERPLFIDFNKSKEKKRKKRIVENMMRRAKDILSMVTLHEMSFTLFEMKPISYDLYMATFGRTNYTQSAVQTFDDGITEEIQTDEIDVENKWTQHPVKFSKADIYLNDHTLKKNKRSSDDYTSKFRFLFEDRETNEIEAFKEYKDNELRILLEQKSGVGNCEMLPYDIYESKLKDINTNSLGKFLKRAERKVSHVLNLNGTVTDNATKSNLPFSSGYVGITTKKVSEEKPFLKDAKITSLIFSEDKSSLILTVHKKFSNGVLAGKSLVCLWDASVARSEPIKILVAIDNVVIGRFRGNTDGLVVAALEDGSLHLWDLSEEPTWLDDVASSKKDELVQVNTELLTAAEIDREFNQKNINVNDDYQRPQIPHALQACAYTSSAANLTDEEVIGRTVGLEFLRATQAQDSDRRVVGQICSLQRLGVLTIWTIIQEKSKTHDLGKAFWSKMRLEKTQTISLTKLLCAKDISDNAFNLNAGKKRMLKRKQEKVLARNFSRQKSESDIDRPRSVANARRLPVENKLPHEWESGVVCEDLKIVQYNNSDRLLVAKNDGEVLSCTRSLGAVKIERLCVSTDTSSITCLEVSPHGPYFLAASDHGTVSLYSLTESRVLLTLDCRNAPPQESWQADFKGRFVHKPRIHSHNNITDVVNLTNRLSVTSVLWSRVNPFCIFTVTTEVLSCWELTHSDIYPKHSGIKSTIASMSSDGTLALVTNDGEVQVHRLSGTRDKTIDYSNLFHRYIALL